MISNVPCKNTTQQTALQESVYQELSFEWSNVRISHSQTQKVEPPFKA